MAFKGKEDNDVEWVTCTIISRAGRAKGKYSKAWNISRDGISENVDFERDVGEFRLLNNGYESTEDSVQESTGDIAQEADEDHSQVNMNAHLAALIEAAVLREENINCD